MDILLVVTVGIAAGVVSGLLGVGGGILFVPGLVLVIGLSQLDGEATSLLAMIPVAAVGALRQARYGNARLREGFTIGALAAGGIVGGSELASRLPVRALEIGFAVLMLIVAAQMLVAVARDGSTTTKDSAGDSTTSDP